MRFWWCLWSSRPEQRHKRSGDPLAYSTGYRHQRRNTGSAVSEGLSSQDSLDRPERALWLDSLDLNRPGTEVGGEIDETRRGVLGRRSFEEEGSDQEGAGLPVQFEVGSAAKRALGQKGQNVITVDPLRTRDVKLDPVAKVEETLDPIALRLARPDEVVEG